MIKKLRYPIIALIIAIDQLVKFSIRQRYEVGEGTDFLNGFFSITYIQNRGAAFSILNGEGVILSVVTGIAMILMVLYMEVNKEKENLLIICICMLIGGGLGNLIDRIFLGYVTDMFDFHFWPVFNIADIFVVVGCVLLCFFVLKQEDKPKEEERLETRQVDDQD